MISGDFEQLLSIPNPWTNPNERSKDRIKGIVLLCFFLTFSLILITSITKTIRTSPGSIPEDKEWDVMSDSNAESGSDTESGKDNSQVGDYKVRKSKE